MGVQGPQGVQGPVGQPGPAGIPGVQGPAGSVGNLWAAQPTPAELVKNVSQAAMDLSPQVFINPRQGLRYVTTLATRLVQLQGSLILRAVLVTEPETEVFESTERRIHSVA